MAAESWSTRGKEPKNKKRGGGFLLRDIYVIGATFYLRHFWVAQYPICTAFRVRQFHLGWPIPHLRGVSHLRNIPFARFPAVRYYVCTIFHLRDSPNCFLLSSKVKPLFKFKKSWHCLLVSNLLNLVIFKSTKTVVFHFSVPENSSVSSSSKI